MQNCSGSCIALSLAANRTRDPFDVGFFKEKAMTCQNTIIMQTDDQHSGRITEILHELGSHNIPERFLGLFYGTLLEFRRGRDPEKLPLPENHISTTKFLAEKEIHLGEIAKAKENPKVLFLGATVDYQELYQLYNRKIVDPKSFYEMIGPLLDELMELLEERALYSIQKAQPSD